jgi:ribosomal protein S18 acetylase RimI-like enzyme
VQNHVCNHKLTIFNNGKRVKIRFLKKQDRDDLIIFFQYPHQKDIRFNNGDDKNSKVLDYCWSQENARQAITLVAQDMANSLPVAFLNLYRNQKASVENGEMQQILIIIPFQGQGSDSRLLDELIALASREQLCWLKLKVMADLEPVIQAFQSKKFEVRAIFEDYLMDPKGKMHDVALMIRQL